jgi:hypothetical protein
MKRFVRSWVIAACILLTPVAADAGLTYTATGGIITGTLNDIPFTNATWSVTGTADPTNVVSGTQSGFPFYFLAMTPLLTITTGSSTLQATIVPVVIDSVSYPVGVFSVDANNSIPGNGLNGFNYFTGESGFLTVRGLGLYTDLQSPFFGSGVQHFPGNFATDVGLFNVTAYTSQGGTFTVSDGSPSSVPEIDPNSLGSVLALVLGSLGLLERRRLKAV